MCSPEACQSSSGVQPKRASNHAARHEAEDSCRRASSVPKDGTATATGHCIRWSSISLAAAQLMKIDCVSRAQNDFHCRERFGIRPIPQLCQLIAPAPSNPDKTREAMEMPVGEALEPCRPGRPDAAENLPAPRAAERVDSLSRLTSRAGYGRCAGTSC